MLKMDLQKLQYQMFDILKKYHVLMNKKSLEVNENPALQREIKDVLYELIALNDKQKIVVNSLRQEKYGQHNGYQNGTNINSHNGLFSIKKENPPESDDLSLENIHNITNGSLDLSMKAENNSNCSDRNNLHLNFSSSSSSPNNKDQTESPIKEERHSSLSSPNPDKVNQREDIDDLDSDEITFVDHGEDFSHKSRLDRIREEMADPVSDDVHDLVTPEEFMHAVVRECQDVVEKRRERRKNNPQYLPFSSTLWERSDTKRKKRVWLTSSVRSPPQLRRKVGATSQPLSRPNSPSGSSGSSNQSLSLSQPVSPGSPEQSSSQSQSPQLDETCPICKIKGADIQCDGCGVIYHGNCVDLPNLHPPPGWLCPTCEQLGLRASDFYNPLMNGRRRGKSRDSSSTGPFISTAGRIDTS